MNDEELLETVSEHTGMMKQALWLRQIKQNERYMSRSLQDLELSYKGRKALVLGAGPGFRRFGLEDLRKVIADPKVLVIACDGALATLADLRRAPGFVVSVDAHPIVANFYRRFRERVGADYLYGTTAILSTTVNPDTWEQAELRFGEVRWFQPFFKDLHPQFYREGITTVWTGGNVGTTCYVLARYFGCSPIGLMGLEFAWSDETPLADTQYFEQIMKLVGNNPHEAARQFKRIENPRDGRYYMADPVYYSYFLAFKDLWKHTKADVKRNTYNLTKQGILNLPGLKYIGIDEFLKK